MTSTHVNGRVAPYAAALVVVVCGLGPGASACARGPATHTVTIDASRFEPVVLTVRAGDTVMWINKDIIPHTATSQAGGFDSGGIDPGNSWTYTPRKIGKFVYICTFHPKMDATLRVE